MVLRTTGLGAGLLGFVLALVHLTPGYVNDRLLGDASGWLPQLDSMGQTVLLYSYTARGVAFVVGIVGVLALGYRVGTRLDLRADYGRFSLVLGVGGAVGYVVATAAFVSVLADGPVLGDATLLTAALWLGRIAGVVLQFAIVGFAGAAFATLVRGSGAHGDPSRAGEDDRAPAGSSD